MRGIPFKATISGDVLKTPGIEWGRPLKILKRRGRRLLVSRDGHSSWSGRGSVAYRGTLYMLIELNGETATVQREETPGRKWRATLDELLKQV